VLSHSLMQHKRCG